MKYVALLRGIGPANPNMRGSKLKAVLEDLGFKNVQPVISSGNVIFESGSKDIAKLEAAIQAEWPKKLGFNSVSIVRSQDQLQALVAKDPFKGVEHSRKTYQLVTFFKNPPDNTANLKNYYSDRGINALCTTLDATAAKTPDFMTKLERQFTKEITSRTYKTLQRILAKFDSTN